MTDLRKYVGGRIQTFRDRAGLSQRAMAEILKISPATVHRLETGVSWGEYETLEAIGKLLGVTIEDFFAEMDHKPIKPTPEEALDVLREALGISKPSESKSELSKEEQKLLSHFREIPEPKYREHAIEGVAGITQSQVAHGDRLKATGPDNIEFLRLWEGLSPKDREGILGVMGKMAQKHPKRAASVPADKVTRRRVR